MHSAGLGFVPQLLERDRLRGAAEDAAETALSDLDVRSRGRQPTVWHFSPVRYLKNPVTVTSP